MSLTLFCRNASPAGLPLAHATTSPFILRPPHFSAVIESPNICGRSLRSEIATIHSTLSPITCSDYCSYCSYVNPNHSINFPYLVVLFAEEFVIVSRAIFSASNLGKHICWFSFRDGCRIHSHFVFPLVFSGGEWLSREWMRNCSKSSKLWGSLQLEQLEPFIVQVMTGIVPLISAARRMQGPSF